MYKYFQKKKNYKYKQLICNFTFIQKYEFSQKSAR